MVAFNRDYIEFGSAVRGFEQKAVDILWTEFPYGAGWRDYDPLDVANSRVSSNYLKDGEPHLIDNLDLFFKAAGLVDIILRNADSEPIYAGFIVGENITISNRVVNGYHVLVANGTDEYEFDPVANWYVQTGVTVASIKSGPKLAKAA